VVEVPTSNSSTELVTSTFPSQGKLGPVAVAIWVGQVGKIT